MNIYWGITTILLLICFLLIVNRNRKQIKTVAKNKSVAVSGNNYGIISIHSAEKTENSSQIVMDIWAIATGIATLIGFGMTVRG